MGARGVCSEDETGSAAHTASMCSGAEGARSTDVPSKEVKMDARASHRSSGWRFGAKEREGEELPLLPAVPSTAVGAL